MPYHLEPSLTQVEETRGRLRTVFKDLRQEDWWAYLSITGQRSDGFTELDRARSNADHSAGIGHYAITIMSEDHAAKDPNHAWYGMFGIHFGIAYGVGSPTGKDLLHFFDDRGVPLWWSSIRSAMIEGPVFLEGPDRYNYIYSSSVRTHKWMEFEGFVPCWQVDESASRSLSKAPQEQKSLPERIRNRLLPGRTLMLFGEEDE